MSKDPHSKHIRELLKLANELGWELKRTGGNHLVFVKPGMPPVFTGSTPSDARGLKNNRARLLRMEASS